jgi:hypothetical protein
MMLQDYNTEKYYQIKKLKLLLDSLKELMLGLKNIEL